MMKCYHILSVIHHLVIHNKFTLSYSKFLDDSYSITYTPDIVQQGGNIGQELGHEKADPTDKIDFIT